MTHISFLLKGMALEITSKERGSGVQSSGTGRYCIQSSHIPTTVPCHSSLISLHSSGFFSWTLWHSILGIFLVSTGCLSWAAKLEVALNQWWTSRCINTLLLYQGDNWGTSYIISQSSPSGPCPSCPQDNMPVQSLVFVSFPSWSYFHTSLLVLPGIPLQINCVPWNSWLASGEPDLRHFKIKQLHKYIIPHLDTWY